MRKTILFALALLVGGYSYLKLTTGQPTASSGSGQNASISIANQSRSRVEPSSGKPASPQLAAAAIPALAANPTPSPANNPAPLTAIPPDDGKISETALRQILAIEAEKEGRSEVQKKIDSQLLFAGKMSRNEPITQDTKTLRVELDRDAIGRILVDIKANVSAGLLAEIERRGGHVVNSYADYQAIRAGVSLDEIENLGQRADVLFIGPAARAERNTGSVNSEGDIAEKSGVARDNFHVTGAGVKVGVLSDSDDYREDSQTYGDLGAVTVLSGQSGRPGSGEGTAMLEIVHDVAPGAVLYYATAFSGVASFADNIRQLRAQGCDIIIDDVGYFNESPFQDGPIAQAVNDVTAAGALFFSSAGNAGNKNDAQSGVWEGDFSDGGQLAAPITGQGRIHSFGAANYNTVGTGGSKERVDLFWADPLGHAGNDYDVYILDSNGANVVAASNNTQDGSQDPYESINKVDVGQRLVVVRKAGAARFINLSTGRGRLTISTGGQTRGHNSAVNAFCVAAVSAENATMPFTTAAKVETFSSDGLRRVFFNADGTPITPGNFSSTGGTVRQKPDIAAADGVKTSLPADSGLNPFFGTSAAAPHAGAIAALLKSYRPGLTPAEMRAALTAGALDIETAGIDRDAGYGLVMADLVLQVVDATRPPTITSFTPNTGPIGMVVNISGAKFTAVSSVKFNGINAAFTIASASQISATVPAGASTGPITVSSPGGTATSANNFSVTTGPAITSFSPPGGSAGTIVVLSGANLSGATAVNFNGAAAVAFTVNSPTQITVTVPTGAATGRISVTTPTGTDQSSTVFTVTLSPVVSSFSPASGAVGTTVTIFGANFVNVTSVKFNAAASVSPTVTSASQIRATVPVGATTGPISVTTASGTGQSEASFIVLAPPAITGLTPANGIAGTVVTVTGSGFAGATAVTFNNVNAAAFIVGSDTQITATAPPAVATGPVRVTTPAGTATSPSSFTVVAASGNDNFAASQTITGSSGNASGNNGGATKEAGEPHHAGNDGGRSVWYRWTAPSAGTWTFDTIGSGFDTLLAVYTGNDLGNLTAVAFNDDIVDGYVTNSRVAFVASAGTTYSIAVDGYWAGAQSPNPPASGVIKLNWTPSAAVPAITGFSPASGPVGTSVIIYGANFTFTTAVTFNGAGAAFTAISATRIIATVPAAATTGPITVSSAGGATMSAGVFTVSSVANNDNFVSAFFLQGSTGTTNCGNAAATKQAGEPNHAGNAGGKSVWFNWTAPANGLWTFDTYGSSFDTLLGIYTGGAVNSLTPIASNDDWNRAFTSQASFNAVAGTSYRIAVDGYAGASGNVALNWTLTPNAPVISSFSPTSGSVGTAVIIKGANLGGAVGVKFNGVSTGSFANNSATQITANVPDGASTGPITLTTSSGVAQSVTAFVVAGAAPVNDDFVQRIALTGSLKTVNGANLHATKQAGEPNHAGNTGGSSVWWTWTAPVSGTFKVTTRDSDFDTTLAVYTGNTLFTLSPVESNDDGQNMGTSSLVSFTATAGTAYHIAVDGYNGETGNIVLTVYPSTASRDIYYTGFETYEGYDKAYTLAGQGGWQVSGEGQNGVVFDYFADGTQQGYLGVSSSVNGESQYLWQPLNYTPNTNTLPVVVFSTYMEIVDSSNFEYDDFGWDVYNQDAKRLFFLDFDNSDLGIYYLPNDGSGYHDTGSSFENGKIYYLELTLDFARNRWNAYLDGNLIVTGQPISATNNVARNLGDIDVAWLRTSETFGDNYMLFDDYWVTAEPNQAPTVITGPQNQSVAVGGNASFLVVVDSPLAVTYQWRFNGAAIPGSTEPLLALSQVGLSQAGNYSVTVSSTAGEVTSAAATLTVASRPNLIVYRPSGWSDKIVAATAPGTNDAATLLASQDIFISWAVLNDFNAGNITNRFYTQLFVDGTLNYTWFSDGLDSGFYTFNLGHNLGKLPAGSHTLRLDTDTTGVVAESNETDNSYSKTIMITSNSGLQPQLGAPSRMANGTFRLTLTGIPARAYEILASTNLVNWSVLATLQNTNPSGVIQYIDPAAANFSRRFYQSRLLP